MRSEAHIASGIDISGKGHGQVLTAVSRDEAPLAREVASEAVGDRPECGIPDGVSVRVVVLALFAIVVATPPTARPWYRMVT
jgi:hypothetical protein